MAFLRSCPQEASISPPSLRRTVAVTPWDSSRFWNRDEYQVGTSPLSYDKQYLRDWLIENKLDGVTPAPQLPADVVAKTQEKYLECLERLVPQK